MKLSTIKQAFFFVLLLSFTANIQILNAQSKDLQKLAIDLKKADIAYQDYSFSVAADYYETYLNDATTDIDETLGKLADCYWQMRNYNDALRVYNLLYPNGNVGANQHDQRRIAELFARFGQYEKASQWLSGVEGYQLKAAIYNSKEKLDLMKEDSLNWKLNFININTLYREFSPFLKDNTLFFSSNKQVPSSKKAFEWDGNNFDFLWKVPVSEIKNVPELLSKNSISTYGSKQDNKMIAGVYKLGDNSLNKSVLRTTMKQYYTSADKNPIGSLVRGLSSVPFNAGTVSMDKYGHVYFSANYAHYKKGVNRIGLMQGTYSSTTGISKIKRMAFGDANLYSVMHPAVNYEGTVIVFSSDKPGGKGGFDLYYAQRENISYPWGAIETFPGNINTVGNEVFPTITPKGDLYFSSDALPGLGGLDIFRIKLSDAILGKVEPEHLSYPVNSAADDFGMTQDSTGLNGYFTSDRLNSDDNIYSFSFEVQAKKAKLFVQGEVKDEISKIPLKNTTVFLWNKADDKVAVSKTDDKGVFRFPVTSSGNVVIKAVEKEHLNNCLLKTYELKQVLLDSIMTTPDILLAPYKEGYKWRLANIHFDNSNFNIRKNELPILDSILQILRKYPITIEIGSHTDSRGTVADNNRLSQHWANTVLFYLVDNEIDPNRITTKGYGESELINKCADGVPCTEAEHLVNRRTEIKVTGYTLSHPEVEINFDQYNDGDKIDKKALPEGFFDNCN